ncbi:MAG: hypothetical protein JST10_01415 [Bacteroidetes bacterium]|nr:hypothetical protein [Bacteroidota bacterium]MBS1631209.1 hypothetical protein [Bacteroidota bacterium]
MSALLYCNCLFSQDSTSPFITKTFTASDGLPHNYVLNISQDSKGYLWVGTVFGLCRFDGTNFSPVRIKGNDKLIPVAASELPDGKYWIWTKSGENFVYDGKVISNIPDSFYKTSYLLSANQNVNWKLKRTHSGINWLESPEGRFINFPNRGVYVNTKGDSIDISRAENPGYFIRIFGYDKKEVYYFTDVGLYAWKDKNLRTLYENQLSGKRIYACYQDSKKRFWIGTKNNGIYVSKPGEENRLDYHFESANNLISGFYEDNEGNMWIAGFEGLIKVQDKNFEILSDKMHPYLFDMNFISKDEKGVIYNFSEKNGVSTWYNGKFYYNKSNLLKNNLVDILCRDDKNRFWCITRRNKIIVFDHGKATVINDSLVNSSEELDWHIVFDNYRKKIWIPGDNLLVGDENGFSVFKDKQNNPIKKPHAMTHIGNDKIIVVDQKGELLKITSGNDVIKIKTTGDLYPGKIYRLFTDSSNNIWVSYPGEGLFQCRLANDSLKVVRKFTIENGLINGLIQSIAFDRNGRLWLSTMGGLAILDITKGNPQGVPVYLYGKDEGIPLHGLVYGRLVCDDNGDMWYSTANSLMKFQGSEMYFNDQPPKIAIESVMLNNQETKWAEYADSLDGIFQIPVDPVLRYYQNTITISFKAATMTDAASVRYSYLLSGVNNYWSSSSKNNTITFTNLKPGRYTFFVRARTNNFSWNSPAKFSFTILKPYWQQWWFKAVIALLSAFIIYLFYRLRINQMHKEKQIRDQIAGDLHDDLGSTLNSVKVYASVAALEKENKPYLDKIQETIREAITSVRDIIWVLDERKDTFDHLAARISYYASPLCDANHIRFELIIDNQAEKRVLKREEKRNLFMIFKEAINNSIKYAECKTIVMSARTAGNNFCVEITDDGKGYDEASVNDGHGIRNILKRSAEIRYRATIKSTKGSGTKIVLEKK